MVWSDSTDAGNETWQSRLKAVRQWLVWQGVNAQAEVSSLGGGLTAQMLSHAADLDADLIVMGAYGHTRWTERVLGGATQGMLSSMTVPVLMSH